MRNALIYSVLVFAGLIAKAQNQNLTISVKDNEKLPLIGATVQLLNTQDSVVLNSITNHHGFSVFETVANGIYIITIRYVGFETIEQTIRVASQRRFEFVMKDDAIALSEVVIVSRRPHLRQEGDKLIIDPEPMVNISTNTLEVLEKTPGLFVDQDGGIFLNSATPAAIYINGREQRMSPQDMTNLLRSLPPDAIQRIEIMRTPSARYSASASGGIINIVLKEGISLGTFGSVSTGFNQGMHGNRFIGLSLNNSGLKTNKYLNVNYNYSGQGEELNSLQLLQTNNNLNTTSQSSTGSNNGFLRYGISHDLRQGINLAYDGRISGNLRKSESDNLNIIINPSLVKLRETQNLNNTDGRFLNLQQDLSMKWKIDTLGSELDTKIGYGFSNNNSVQDYEILFAIPQFNPVQGRGENSQVRHSFNAQSDLTYKFSPKASLETGFRVAFQRFESTAEYFLQNNNNWVGDPQRNNTYNYNENINALYAQASIDLPGNFSLKTGARLENTVMRGNQIIPEVDNFDVDRWDIFPYAFLSRKILSAAGFDLKGFLIFRRTIDRPGYQNLNPYRRYVDEFLYEAGNPNLSPQFSNNIEVNLSFDEHPVFAFGRNYITNIFSNVVYQDNNNPNVSVRTFDNLGKNTETYFRLILAIPPGGRYFGVGGAQYNLNEYNGLYQNEPLTFKRGSWRLFTFHSLRLAKNTRLTMFGFMMTKGQFNFYELETFGMLNFGLNQTLLNGKLSISLSANDVLRTMVTNFTLKQGAMNVEGNRYTDNRRFGVNVRYRFGSPPKVQERQNMFDMNGNMPE